MLPRYVEIRFKALSAAAVRQLEGNGSITKQDWASESTSPNSNYYLLIRPSLQQFVMRVPVLKSSALPGIPPPKLQRVMLARLAALPLCWS